MRSLIHFLQEVSHLAHTPRTGFPFLGTGNQTVAEHTYIAAMIGWLLSHQMEEEVDPARVVFLCLLHDLPESRTGDLNYVHKRYLRVDMEKVLNDMKKYPFFSDLFLPYIREYEEKKTRASIVAHDADQLELILQLKKQLDLGNTFSTDWIANAEKRLQTDQAKKMAKAILEEKFFNWWLLQD